MHSDLKQTKLLYRIENVITGEGKRIEDNTIQYNTVQYNTIQYNTIQYNTIQDNKTVREDSTNRRGKRRTAQHSLPHNTTHHAQH